MISLAIIAVLVVVATVAVVTAVESRARVRRLERRLARSRFAHGIDLARADHFHRLFLECAAQLRTVLAHRRAATGSPYRSASSCPGCPACTN